MAKSEQQMEKKFRAWLQANKDLKDVTIDGYAKDLYLVRKNRSNGKLANKKLIDNLNKIGVSNFYQIQTIKDFAARKASIDKCLSQMRQANVNIGSSSPTPRVQTAIAHYEEFLASQQLEDFTPQQKKVILKRDNYRCVICGLGVKDGIELHADHIKPKDKGGKATIANGQTLCATHNFRKKNYRQTETGKKMFIRLYDAAKEINDTKTMQFCTDILEVFEKNNVNGHIKWKK